MSLEVLIHSRLAIRSLEVPALSLWYLCRGLDKDGSGFALINKDLLNSTFDVSRTTIWRWLNDRDLFRCYRRCDGGYKIYYRSLPKVCLKLGVPSLGGIGWSDSVSDLAAQAAYIEAQKRQQQSIFLAKLTSEDLKVIHPEVYFDRDGLPLSAISPGSRAAKAGRIENELTFNNRRVLLLKKHTPMYGTSIKGVADGLGICYSTAQRLLSQFDTHRIQVAQRVNWIYFYKSLFDAEENLGKETESGFFFSFSHIPLKLCPYRYYPLYALASQKALRCRVTRAFLSP